MLTLTKNILFITLLTVAKAVLKIKIDTGNNYIVKLFRNDPEHSLKDYCVAKFTKRNEQGEGLSIDKLIEGNNEISVKMDWLTSDMSNDICIHRHCHPVKGDQPICKSFDLPSLLSFDTDDKSIKLNFEPSQPSANEFEVSLKFQGKDISTKVMKIPFTPLFSDGLSPSPNYSLSITPISRRRLDHWTVSYELNCTTKQGDHLINLPPLSIDLAQLKLDDLIRTVESLSVKINFILGLLIITLLALLISMTLNFMKDSKMRLNKKKHEGDVLEQESLHHSPSKSLDSSWVTSGGSIQGLGRLGTEIRLRKAEKNEQEH